MRFRFPSVEKEKKREGRRPYAHKNSLQCTSTPAFVPSGSRSAPPARARLARYPRLQPPMASPESSRARATSPRLVVQAFGSLLNELLDFTLSVGGSNEHTSQNPCLLPIQSFHKVLCDKLASLPPSQMASEFDYLTMDSSLGPQPPHATFVTEFSSPPGSQRIPASSLFSSPPDASGSSTPAVPTPPPSQNTTPPPGDTQGRVTPTSATHDGDADYESMDSSSTMTPPDMSYLARKQKATHSPAGKSKAKRRQLIHDRPTPPPPVLLSATQLESLLDSKFNKFSSQQEQQSQALSQQLASQFTKIQEKTDALDTAIAAQAQRLSICEDQHSQQTSKLSDLITRVSELESWVRQSAENSTPCTSCYPSTPSSQPPSTPLSFPVSVSDELAERIAKSEPFQLKNANSFVIFSARDHLKNLEPTVFAQQVANLFGGSTAAVESTSWLGVDKSHLRVTLTLPLAEDVGSSFWKNKQTYGVEYYLAPCRTRLLRDGMSRMITATRTLRNKLPELHIQRTSATTVSFLGKFHFNAVDFLYPAIRLGDDRIIPISQIVNAPSAPVTLYPPDPSLSIPGPR